MRGNVGLVALVVLFGCGEVVKHRPDGPLGDDADTGDDAAAEDGDIVDVLPIDGPPIDVPPGAPNIAAMDPDWGSTAGGTNVKLTGVGFTVAGLVVKFGTVTVPTTGITVVSDTELRIVTPAGPHMAVDVNVTTSGGTSTFPVKFRNIAPLYAADSRAAGTAAMLYTINPANGASTTIGGMGMSVTGLTLSPTGILYGAVSTAPSRLVVINPYTAQTTLVGNFTINGTQASGVCDLAWVGTKLVGWTGSTMNAINPTSGVLTPSAPSGAAKGCGIAATSATSMAYASAGATPVLYSVNTANGVASAGPGMNVPANQGINSMAFVGATLVACVAASGPNTTRLYAVNTANGQVTLRGTMPPNVDAIAGIPTQPAVPRTVGTADGALADELATTAVRFESQVGTTLSPDVAATAGARAVEIEPTLVWRGKRVATGEVLSLGTDRDVDGQTRRVVPLAALADGARAVVLSNGTQTTRIVVENGLAIVPNRRGELKLVDTRLGGKKLFGPITELRAVRGEPNR